MVNVYQNLRDENGELVNGRTKLFVKSCDDVGVILEFTHGVAFIVDESGTQFIVDEWLIEQLDKVQFIDGVLSVKDEEELIPPVKTERELQREELLRQIAELDAAEDEPVDIEEPPEEQLLLDYTDEPSE